MYSLFYSFIYSSANIFRSALWRLSSLKSVPVSIRSHNLNLNSALFCLQHIAHNPTWISHRFWCWIHNGFWLKISCVNLALGYIHTWQICCRNFWKMKMIPIHINRVCCGDEQRDLCKPNSGEWDSYRKFSNTSVECEYSRYDRFPWQ